MDIDPDWEAIMGCGCKERGQIITQAFRSVRAGNVRQAAQRTGVVVRSMGNDAARLAREAAARALRSQQQSPRR